MRGTRSVAMLLVGVVTLGACGADDRVPSAGSEPSSASPVDTAVSPTTVPPTTVPPTTASVVPITGVYDQVVFYPACGNETLVHEDVTWYPVIHVGYGADESLQGHVDEIAAVEREPSPVVGARGFVRVAEPGPGDDIGTLVVWADGVARWVSDSRLLDVMMIDDEVTYNWVC